MISVSAVSKRYPEELEAVKEISFEINAGEMVFITGHSGAGKSTLFRLLAAIERPTSGTIVVNGQNLATLRKSAIPYLRRSFGLIFQDQKLLFDRSVLDNVLLPLAIAGMPTKEAIRRARAALDKVGLLEREKAYPIALSGGEQQRLAIARAVVNRPAILLADEPTANLDLAAIERPTSGTIVVNGQNLATLHKSAIPYLRRNFGLIFQDQKLLFDRSVLDNVLLPLAIAGMPTKEAIRRARAALDKVGLPEREEAYPIALSGGEQQRLAIARAVVNRPTILLADEPTANLDPASAADILAIFLTFHQAGVTLVIATHDPLWLANVSARTLRLDHGRLLGDAA